MSATNIKYKVTRREKVLATVIQPSVLASSSSLSISKQSNVTIRKRKQKNTSNQIDNDVVASISPFALYAPNWKKNLENTVTSLVRFKLFSVPQGSLEFDKIVQLMGPMIDIKKIEQIVNPTLWERFDNQRKEMIRSKSDDLTLLSKFLNETQMLQSSHFLLNFVRSPAVAASTYNDNTSLLFHCTGSAANIDKILSQGLDERLGRSTGQLGKGIYFADDPIKSMQYDRCGGVMFIFGVILGDCVCVDHMSQKNLFVREPEKDNLQKRNFNDVTFDSVVAQPDSKNNEYVIYNRYQCCPLYKISYEKTQNRKSNGVYSESQKNVPPFSWKPVNGIPMPSPMKSTWPFHAKLIFAQMGAAQEDEIKEIQTKSSSSESVIIDLTDSPDKKIKIEKNDDAECCQICYSDVSEMIILKCSHKVCTVCYTKIETTRTTMGGIIETFVKCPFCMGVCGTEVGTCPDGTLEVSILPSSCAGYENFSTIYIRYIVTNSKYLLNRRAYLPNNDEGKEVLRLLKIAWDRRLCFAIGTSLTTGRANVLVWNIHHKTAQTGGAYGFPDITYLERIKNELKAYGIE